MNYHRSIYAIAMAVLFFTSACKKALGPVNNISLNVVNASPGIANAAIRTPNTIGDFSQLTGVNYTAGILYTIPANATIHVFSSADTTHSLYDHAFATGPIYSLFIAGNSGEDMVLNQDMIPYRADSSFGVRFANMSSNSGPVNIALSTSSATNEFTEVAYKSITGFNSYAAIQASPGSYTFQVMDAGNNILISSSVSSSGQRFKNVTLVLSGTVGGSGPDALSLFTVNNY